MTDIQSMMSNQYSDVSRSSVLVWMFEWETYEEEHEMVGVRYSYGVDYSWTLDV